MKIYRLFILPQEHAKLQEEYQEAQIIEIIEGCLIFYNSFNEIIRILNKGVWADVQLVNKKNAN